MGLDTRFIGEFYDKKTAMYRGNKGFKRKIWASKVCS